MYPTYTPALDQLSPEDQFQLEKCLKTVEKYVKASSEISDTDHATRNAHAKTYAAFRGTLKVNHDVPEPIRRIFSEDSYEVFLRLSQANAVITKAVHDTPLYGFTIKIKDIHGADANFPMVNFPVFPEVDPSRFLKMFSSFNTFMYTKADNYVVAALDLPHLFKNTARLLPSFFRLETLSHFKNLLARRKDFLLGFDYFAIGVYRMGNFMVKFSAEPDYSAAKYAYGLPQRKRLDIFLKEHSIRYSLKVQFCQDLDRHPVNDLGVEWKDSPYYNVGFLEFTKYDQLDDHLPEVENLSFSPFENPAELEPVGKIQQIRKKVYDVSISTRNVLNEQRQL